MPDGDALKEEVEADEKAIRRMGPAGIPFCLINDRLPVRGIQAPEHFVSILNQAWQAQGSQATQPFTGLSCEVA